MFLGGANRLAGLCSQVNQRLTEERERLDEQYALDQVALARDSGDSLVETLESVELDEGELASQRRTVALRRPAISTLSRSTMMGLTFVEWRGNLQPYSLPTHGGKFLDPHWSNL